MPYILKQESIELLIDGFNQSSNLKKLLIKSIHKKEYFNEEETTIDSGIAWKVLFHSFNEHTDVINLIKIQFENEEFPFISADSHEIFQNLLYYFKDKKELVPSVEKWLDNRLERYSFVDPKVAFASIFIHSTKCKNILLQDLPKSSISHWNVMALLDGWDDDEEIKEKLKEYFRTVETTKTSASAHFMPKVFDSSEKDEAIKILEGILFDKKITFRERSITALIELDKEYFENNILEPIIEELESFPKDLFGQYYTALDIIVKNFHSNTIVQSYILERIKNDNSLYTLAIQYFPELIKEEEEKLLEKSIPLTKDLRLLIIESFANLTILPSKIESVLSNFEEEAEEEIMGDMAVCLFNHIKETKADKILELSKPIVFARGFDYEVKRNIAFTGYLIMGKLDEYLLIEGDDNPKEQSRMLDIFSEQDYRKSSSGIMIKSIIDNFDYLFSFVGKDFKSIVDNLKFKKNTEEVWGFFARHSVKSSPTYNYIMEFITNNSSTIKNNSLISFLNRTAPKSPILKDILLRFINAKNNNRNNYNVILAGRLLGANFNSDHQVYKEVSMVKGVNDTGRIMALCNGWQEDPVLKKIFNDIVNNQIPVNNYISFNLKFLFREVSNLTEFIKGAFTSTGEFKRNHRYLYVPMIERLKRDKDFSLAIKELLLSSNSISEKISYYNLLAQVNMVDEDTPFPVDLDQDIAKKLDERNMFF